MSTPTLDRWINSENIILELEEEALEERKAQAVQSALMGLPVTYLRHYGDGLTPNMAKVNGCSIIWHSASYGHNDPEMVEVMGKRNDGIDTCERVKISELREYIS